MVKPDKSRYVWLYLPSQNDKSRWFGLAEQAKVPLSRFIIEIVENALAEESELKPWDLPAGSAQPSPRELQAVWV